PLYARHLVRAEKVRLAQCRQHSEERLGAAHLLAEILERMGQRVANREAQRAQPEGVQKNRHLMPNAHRAVLQVAIIKAQAWIEENLLHAVARGDFDLPSKIIAH